MTDRPIIFSAPMVRALLKGRKTQTRRVLKLPTKGEYVRRDMGGWAPTTNGGGGVFRWGRDGTRIPVPETIGIWNQTTGSCVDAPYQVGNRLWVREAHKLVGGGDPGIPIYRANWREDAAARGLENIPDEEPKGWRSSIHMPRWASRLTLTVVDVRVQRLQDLNEEDALAEGIEPAEHDDGRWIYPIPSTADYAPHPIAAFSGLWERLHGPDAWATNPCVVAPTFTVERRNIDAPPRAPVEKHHTAGRTAA